MSPLLRQWWLRYARGPKRRGCGSIQSRHLYTSDFIEYHLSAWHDECGRITTVLIAKKMWKFLKPIDRPNCIVANLGELRHSPVLSIKRDIGPHPIKLRTGRVSIAWSFSQRSLQLRQDTAHHFRRCRWSVINSVVQLRCNMMNLWMDQLCIAEGQPFNRIVFYSWWWKVAGSYHQGASPVSLNLHISRWLSTWRSALKQWQFNKIFSSCAYKYYHCQ